MKNGVWIKGQRYRKLGILAITLAETAKVMVWFLVKCRKLV